MPGWRCCPGILISAPATQVQNEIPKQTPTPPVDKPAGPESDETHVPVLMDQARRTRVSESG
jgi:hypothetical protein